MENDQPVVPDSIESVQESTYEYFLHHLGRVALCGAVVLIAEALIFFFFTSDVIFYLIPLLLPGIWYLIVHGNIQDEFIHQFAVANGFHYEKTGTVEGLEGSVFKIGHSQTVTDVAKGTYGTYPVSLFAYRYTVGSGKSAHSYSFTIFELQFDAAIPDMLLKQKDRDFGDLVSGIFDNTKEKITLEGDFNNYFTLSIAKGYEVEALEVFTPKLCRRLLIRLDRSVWRSFMVNYLSMQAILLAVEINFMQCMVLLSTLPRRSAPVLGRMKPALEAEKTVMIQ